MKISVVTSVYNGASTVQQTMQSVQAQSHEETEHVIIDGNSSDETAEIVRRHMRSEDQFVSEPDEGIYDALNKGVKLSSGEVVGVIGSDDFYAGKDVFRRIASVFEDKKVDAVYGDLAYVRGDSPRIVRYWKPGPYKVGSFGKGWVPPHPTFFCRRDLYDKLGFFRLDLPVAADFELLIRFIVKHEINVEYLDKAITVMRLGGTSNRLSGIVAGNRSIAKAFELNGERFPFSYLLLKPIGRCLQYLGPRPRTIDDLST